MEDMMWVRWQEAAPRIYDQIYYRSNPIVAYVNNSGHRLVEKPYGRNAHFSRVLEVGAGTGEHLASVRHRFDNYVLTDINPELLREAERKFAGRNDLSFQVEDATKLSFADATFDRLVSVYNLEHLPQPHLVLKEWKRVVRPGGTISIAIPAEGGVAWRFGRWLTTRRSFAEQGLDLDYIIAREHINTCYNLAALIRNIFSQHKAHWFPTGLPITDFNLVYTCQIKV